MPTARERRLAYGAENVGRETMEMIMASSLEDHLKWLNTEDCKCEYQWKSLGRLYGVSFGKGWVRMTTNQDCQYHGKGVKE